MSDEVRPMGNTDDAVEFLRNWNSDGEPHHVVGITPTDKPSVGAYTFGPDQESQLRGWIENGQSARNMYFHVNCLRPDAFSIKAQKKDVVAARAVHVDVDDVDALDRIEAFVPPASVVTMSGGGYQAFWLLASDETDLALIENINRGIGQQLGGDDTHNIDRIMRIPGTVNVPNKLKRAKGRKPVNATLVRADWSLRYTTDALKQFAASKAEPETQSDGLVFDRYPLGDRLEKIIADGSIAGEKKPSRSEWLFEACCELVRCGRTDEEIVGVIMDAANGISASVLDKPNPRKYAEKQAHDAREAASANGALVLSEKDHLGRAGNIVRNCHPTLQHWRSEFHEWRDGLYKPIHADTMTSMIWQRLGSATIRGRRGPEPFPAGSSTTKETIAAMASIRHLKPEREAPFWINGDGPSTTDLIAFPNGLLNTANGEFLPPTPNLFSHAAAGFDYQPEAPMPRLWLRFLLDTFGGEKDQIRLLQEWMGYCLTGDTSYQKILLMLGGRRSGKGTIVDIMRGLLAEGTYAGPTTSSFNGEFGMQQLIHKQIAIVDDMRIENLSAREKTIMAERLLTISGGGFMSINRKNTSFWDGKLPIKIILISNLMPDFPDSSGVLSSRFLVLQTRSEHFDDADKTLAKKLLLERQGIMLWALAGLRRLNERERFAETNTSRALRMRLQDAGSPIMEFVADHCILDPEATTSKDDLFFDYLHFCKMNDQKPMGRNKFFEALYAAYPRKVSPKRPRDGEDRTPIIKGLRLAKRLP